MQEQMSGWPLCLPPHPPLCPPFHSLHSLLHPLADGCVFSVVPVEMVKATRKQQRKQQRKQEGGKRKGTRKLSKGASAWHKHMMKVYKEMKAKNPSTSLGDAMKAAKKRKGEMKE